MRLVPPKATSVSVAGAFAVALFAYMATSATSQRRGAPSPEQMTKLRAIGETLTKAVLARDVATLLAYDRSDLRASDRVSIQDAHSDLYCFLFDRSCNLGRASVLDILSGATRLAIDVQILEPKDEPPTTALLLFYDAAGVPASSLSTSASLCNLSRRGAIASWTFILVAGEWVSAHPIFDSETDTLCDSIDVR